MNFIKPASENNFLIICEHCKSIINFSKEDCFCAKTVDIDELILGRYQNITKVYIECPNCQRTLDVAGGLRYLENDKRWF